MEYIHLIVEASKAFERNKKGGDYLKLGKISNDLMGAEADALDHGWSWDDIINARSVGENIARVEEKEAK